MANQGQQDPVVLPIVPCPDCGRDVAMHVARRGQSAGQRFYKCRNHNPGAGGCDFYRWQEAYAAHLGVVLPAAEPGDQIQAAVDQPQAQINQPPVHQPLQNHGPEWKTLPP
ncbi:uncharacterized protein LOC119319484 [Triticum dicoccoides]|uniref:uncharacterized protein LOC119319484 n=1 Tax=Triticum dicoccoides TaxID=85692 RepID=UPI00188E25EA|nr:uncharacterized protein LOC119319484 [Triticum dicoccoides]